MTPMQSAIDRFGMDLALLGIAQARALAEQVMPAVVEQMARDLAAPDRYGPCEECGQDTDLLIGPMCDRCNGRV